MSNILLEVIVAVSTLCSATHQKAATSTACVKEILTCASAQVETNNDVQLAVFDCVGKHLDGIK